MTKIDLSLFDISTIEAQYKQKNSHLYKHDPKNAAACDRPNCQEPAYYKAPKSPQNLNQYRYFCLKHIQEHNARWNYCENMTEQDIVSHLEKDIVGHRPTWQSGMSIKGGSKKTASYASNEAPEFSTFDDPFDLAKTIFNTHKPNPKQKKSETKKPNTAHDKSLQKIIDACNVLSVEFPPTLVIVKQNYKKLVKQYHPDINKTDKDAEQKLRIVVDSYRLIADFLGK